MLAILGCIGLGIIYGLKVNLSVAIVSMVNHTAIDILNNNNTNNNEHQDISSSKYVNQQLDESKEVCSDEGNSTGPTEVSTCYDKSIYHLT